MKQDGNLKNTRSSRKSKNSQACVPEAFRSQVKRPGIQQVLEGVPEGRDPRVSALIPAALVSGPKFIKLVGLFLYW